MAPIVIGVVGPTAAGKSELALALAQRLDGEIVNADSMQLYRGMDIGTAKLTPDERAGVPHHLLDVWHVTEAASVADYQRRAQQAIAEIHGRGRTPIVVGGSGLYVRAALDEMDFPGTDAGLRAELEAELAALGAPALHARLTALDPQGAAAILPTNGRRVVRALEVITLTGRPFAATLPQPAYLRPTVQVGIDIDYAELDRRIALRVQRMWELGLLDEVRRLVDEGLREGRTASRALGYQQVLRALAGECTLEEAREETVTATRRFARRQRSWFRRDERIVWLPPRADLLDRSLDAVAPQGAR